jgi:uncharacterized repeat protein (TIGR01451 family)
MFMAVEILAGWRRCRVLLAVLAVGAAGLSAVPAAAALVPLHMTMTHFNPYGAQASQCPTTVAEPLAGEPCGVNPYTEKEAGDKGETFARNSGGNTYTITVENLGEEATGGPVTVVDQFPKGLVLTTEGQFVAPGWKCAPELEGRAISCTTSGALPAKGVSKPITVYMLVNPDAANPSLNVATATATGASSASTGEKGKTTVTPAVPFGISTFTTSVFDKEQLLTEPPKEAFSQAGGHPFAVTTEIILNYNPDGSAEHPNALDTAGVGAKELLVDAPPGFIGNPQNALPRCPLQFVHYGSTCPANTAIGYEELNIEGTTVEHGKAAGVFRSLEEAKLAQGLASLVYNVAPSYGHPAEFGFFGPNSLPFLLDASLRSDGDYGVTVGDTAVGQKPLAVKVTFCENGAEETPGPKATYLCKPAPAGTHPFLTSPTECSSSASVWTARANSWVEQAHHVSKTAVGPNPVKECQSLHFNPGTGIEFVPSPPLVENGTNFGGTSQADEPTGMTLNLHAPQTNDAAVNAPPELKTVKMTLPLGMTVSPSAADGLQACTNAQYWRTEKAEKEEEEGKVPTEPGTAEQEAAEHREPAVEAKCPPASQIGTAEVFTPLLSGQPEAGGVPTQNQVLTCSPGMWSGSRTLSYQWLVNGVAIKGATSSTFTLPTEIAPPTEPKYAEYKGKPLQCQVTATNANGSSVATSREIIPLPGPPTTPPFPPPSIAAPSGTAAAGNTLTCVSEVWTGNSPPFSYRWLRGGLPIAGPEGEKEKYTLSSEDEGKVIQCQLTGKNEYENKVTKKFEQNVVIADSAAVVVSPVPSSAPAPPLPGAALQGQLFVAQPECGNTNHPNPCEPKDAEDGKLFRLFLQARDPVAGVIVKLHGFNKVNESTGQITSVFEEQPQQPFELLQLKLNGGPRAPLANPQSCGSAVTTADITPWSTPFVADAMLESSFNVEGCALSFAPSFNGGTSGANATGAAAPTNFSLTFRRNDREQNLSAITVNLPAGLVGRVPAVKECGEAEVEAAEHNEGGCPQASEIGTATSLAGPGPDPFPNTGHVYFTGPYKGAPGAPFGIVVITPAVAGPFNLGNVVVRSAININPYTAAVTATTPKLPQIVDGVPLRLRQVNVNVTKPGFMYNPTNCEAQQVSATLKGAQGNEANVASPFGITGCKSLPFAPHFTASTQANASKTQGANLNVKITYPPGAYANVAKTLTELPAVLPSRLTTLQKACLAATFEANPATCPEGSVDGYATVHTPTLNQPVSGPAYLVSHGGASFPDLEIVLQGEGVEVILDGQTDIKKGVTKTTFNAVPDSPVETFELNLPQGPHSVLAANGDLCAQPLILPTVLTGQNGAVIKQSTHIAVVGCPPTVKIAKVKLAGNSLLVTVTMSAGGTVRISGKGLKTTTKKLKAGTHQIRVALTKAGRSARKHHKNTMVHVRLTVGKQAVAKATTVRL